MKTGSFSHMKKGFILLLVVVCASLAATSVFAQTQATAPMNVNAVKGSGFTVSVVSDVDFGTVNASGTYPEVTPGAFTVQGSNGVAYQIGIDGGAHTTAFGWRRVDFSGNQMGYDLTRDAARTLVWGTTGLIGAVAVPYTNGAGNGTYAATGTGAVQNYSVYGILSVAGTEPDGTYTDTVNVIVEW